MKGVSNNCQLNSVRVSLAIAFNVAKECFSLSLSPSVSFSKALENLEEVMDYRTYCETMAGLLPKPIVKLLRNLKVSRNVKWIYQEGISISRRHSLAHFNGKLQ